MLSIKASSVDDGARNYFQLLHHQATKLIWLENSHFSKLDRKTPPIRPFILFIFVPVVFILISVLYFGDMRTAETKNKVTPFQIRISDNHRGFKNTK